MFTEIRGLKIMPCTPEHIEKIPWTDQDPAFEPYARQAMKQCADGDSTFALMAPEGVVMCGGLAPVSPGVAYAWLMASELIQRYPLAACAACMEGLAFLAEKQDLHRVQTAIYPAFTKGRIFAEWLGFKFEGVMRRYSPDRRDYYLYAKLF